MLSGKRKGSFNVRKLFGLSPKSESVPQTFVGKLKHIFLLLIFWVSAIFVIGEIGVRIFCDPLPGVVSCIEEVDDDRHYVLKPNNTISFEGLYEPLRKPVIWKVNGFGERIGEAPKKMTKSFSEEIEIVTYGDSESYGWGVSHEETYQKQLEEMDTRIKTYNFGVPGYNVYQVAEHAVRTGHLYNSSVMLYLVNENDFDITFAFNRFPKHSELLKRLVFVSYLFKEKKAKKMRGTIEVKKRFADELVKMKRYCESNEMELVLAFLNWENSQVLKLEPELVEYFLGDDGMPNRNIIDVSSVHGMPEIDKHYIKEGHEKLAKLILRHLYENDYLSDN